jgi:hypothetical protein
MWATEFILKGRLNIKELSKQVRKITKNKPKKMERNNKG